MDLVKTDPLGSCCWREFDRNRNQSESEKPLPSSGHGNLRAIRDCQANRLRLESRSCRRKKSERLQGLKACQYEEHLIASKTVEILRKSTPAKSAGGNKKEKKIFPC